MLIYVIWYLIVGAIVTLFHPWLRRKFVEIWAGEAKGKEIVGKLVFAASASLYRGSFGHLV